jgi:hypothetical protein
LTDSGIAAVLVLAGTVLAVHSASSSANQTTAVLTPSEVKFNACDAKLADAVASVVSIDINNSAAQEVRLTQLALKFGPGALTNDVSSDFGEWERDVYSNTSAPGSSAAHLQANRDVKQLISHQCSEIVYGTASVPSSSTPTTVSTTPTTSPPFLAYNGTVFGVETAIKGWEPNLIEASTVHCAGRTARLTTANIALCNWVGVNGLGDWAYAIPAAMKRFLLLGAPQFDCDAMRKAERLAVEAFEDTNACVSPTGIYVPNTASAVKTTSGLGVAVESAVSAPSSPVGSFQTAGDLVEADPDSHDPNWIAYYELPSAGSSGAFPAVGGLAHNVDGTWVVVSGPAFALSCKVPGSVPASIFTDLHISRASGCPPTPPKPGAAAVLASSTPTTRTTFASPSSGTGEVTQPDQPLSGVGQTWTPAPSSFATALSQTLLSGGGTALGSGYSFWLSQDKNNPSWYEFNVVADSTVPTSIDGAAGTGIGVAQLSGGSWKVAGPYNQGGEWPDWVPSSVISDFAFQ